MRTVRLKETPPGVQKPLTPSDAYREACDSTLGQGPFMQRGTVHGFLDTGNERSKAYRNLVMLGGSFVESMFVDELHRFPSIVERALPQDWCVLNGGYSGMTTLHMLAILSAKIPTVMTPGSKLILFIGQSDSNAMATDGSYWSDTKTLAPISPHPVAPFSPWGPKESVKRTIDALLSTAEAFGFEYGVVASPFRDSDFSNDQVLRKLYRRQRRRYESAVERRRFVQEVAKRAANARGRPFLDGQAVVEQHHFYDAMHLNAAGQPVFASAITAWLAQWM